MCCPQVSSGGGSRSNRHQPDRLLLAGLFPARASARIAPARAIRFDPSVALVKGSVPLLERMLAFVFHLSTSTKITLRNLFRNRQRTLTTSLGFIFAFIVLLACWAMLDGIDYMLQVQFRQTDRWDLQAMFMQPQTYTLLVRIDKILFFCYSGYQKYSTPEDMPCLTP